VPSYERFAAWRRSYEFVLAVYDAPDAFPKNELYGLTSQTRRAAFSVVANIAEGSAKRVGGCIDQFEVSDRTSDVLPPFAALCRPLPPLPPVPP